ncbi:MAG: hypothetical protein MZW92_02060 [Comamonadaceae bacterium]|nr:hypothetical protein [Comamonadaceae bacterium]
MLWIHPDRAEPLGIARRRRGRGQRRRQLRRAAARPRSRRGSIREAVFMLHGYGATVPLATRALGVGVADQRLQHGKLYEFDPAGGGNALTETIVRIKRRGDARSTSMSKYALRHDEANCIGCQACEVHCKSNKGLGPGPSPCKIISTGPIDVGGVPRVRHHLHALLPLRGGRGASRPARPAPCSKREKDGIVHVQAAPVRGLQELHHRLPLGHAAVGPGHATRSSSATTAWTASMPACSRPASPSA